ncbi:arginyl-tRNA synthetase [Nitzschia inconspicua]|uniref:arginine--tRNA ligase n=1 Tax=Nitzschia inconspicua TaxID=303405 RepID=A0A9K3KZT4_9STRA|nr:arginyl-tRNA synthetase [Nitzschia inconspicua]
MCSWTLPARAFGVSRQKVIFRDPVFQAIRRRALSTSQVSFPRLFKTGRTPPISGISSLQQLNTIKRIQTPAALFLSTTTTSSTSPSVSVKSMGYVQDAVLEALRELFDPAEVARGAALAKLEKPKKKKKKQDTSGDSEDSSISEEEKKAIADMAAKEAKPFSIADTMVTLATRAGFGDYQVNAAMGLAKSLGMNPRECASMIVEKIRPKIEDFMEEPEIAGPGFINLRFKPEYLTSVVEYMASDPAGRLGLPKVSKPQKIIIDYSSPNIAKEMHVGHLRSTIIGDTLSNLLSFSGHDVVRLNHVGDWGTQFGMLVEHLRDEYPAALSLETSQDVDLGDLVELYKAAKKRFDVDDEFKARAREGVVNLQAGNDEEIAAWQALCAASRVEYQKIYDMLGIKGLQERGESFYNPYLKDVVEDLESKGLAVESEGATAVFLEGYTNRDGTPLPMLVRKSDGGFNYATTDLAAIRQRVEMTSEDGGERANRVLYVTDAGQAQHFDMVFSAAKMAGYVPEGSSLEHVPFGLVQGEDGKKFATRSGDTVRLKDLLNEAVRIAGDDLRARTENENVPDDVIDQVARIIGIGAVKYADLSMNRESNYRFSYERMLSLNGNTAPYMLYSYARICGIIRKASGQEVVANIKWPEASKITITDESEMELIRSIVRLPDILTEVEQDLYPNRLCDFLFETSQKFNKFYESCSVNKAESPEVKSSRLTLCTATAGTIRLVMNLLGIEVVEKM